MGRKSRGAAMDFSSFMCVILMLIGVLMILLISNVLTIISNPENVQISAVIKGALYADKTEDEDQGLMVVPKFMNKAKEAVYVDVYGDQIIIYPEKLIVPVVELEKSGNAFERLLNTVALKKNELYIVLLARPRSARVLRRLRTAIHDREVDIGFELYEEGRTIDVAATGEKAASSEEEPAPAEGEAGPETEAPDTVPPEGTVPAEPAAVEPPAPAEPAPSPQE